MSRTYALATSSYDDPDAMYAAMASQPYRMVTRGGTSLEITFADGPLGFDQAVVMTWIERLSMAMSVYFGHYPVEQNL